jgi:hypothetical protein
VGKTTDMGRVDGTGRNEPIKGLGTRSMFHKIHRDSVDIPDKSDMEEFTAD